jgi:hypothetical protein
MTDVVSLLDISDNGVTLTIDGREFTLKPLSMGDICKAQAHVRNDRLQRFLSQTRVVPLPDDVRAKAIAEITCQTITFVEMVTSYDGQLRLLFEAMHRADSSITWDYVQNAMPPIAARILDQLMYVLGGLSAPDGETDPTTSTSATRNLSDGTKNSAGSVIPSA